MLTRNPGDDPLALPWSITQDPSGIASGFSIRFSVQAPRKNSSSPRSRAPMRLVNHDESGTSSRLFTSTASPGGSMANTRASGRKNRLSAPSQISGETYVRGAQTRCCGSFFDGSTRQATVRDTRSSSRVMGARSGNGCSPAHATRASTNIGSTRRTHAMVPEGKGVQNVSICSAISPTKRSSASQSVYSWSCEVSVSAPVFLAIIRITTRFKAP